jgi:hypothetical protein
VIWVRIDPAFPADRGEADRGAPPQAQAGAWTTTLGPGNIVGCTNAGMLSGINISNATVTTGVVNTGTISPGGVNLTNKELGLERNFAADLGRAP